LRKTEKSKFARPSPSTTAACVLRGLVRLTGKRHQQESKWGVETESKKTRSNEVLLGIEADQGGHRNPDQGAKEGERGIEYVDWGIAATQLDKKTKKNERRKR